MERFSSEYFKELHEKCYERDRLNKNNFSYWYPKILDYGRFIKPEVLCIQVFNSEELAQMQEVDNIEKVDWEKYRNILKPTLDNIDYGKMYLIKNGCFSNKFDFQSCLTNKHDLPEKFWKLQYQSAMYDTGGETEIVTRKLISYDPTIQPTIYNGLVLREEIRAFYDMDKHRLLYTVDYWDYDYCIDNITDKSDRIVFDWFHNEITGRVNNHKTLVNMLQNEISDRINTVKFSEDLHGIWSIDFMYVQEQDNGKSDRENMHIYLIDMAEAEKSAYWRER